MRKIDWDERLLTLMEKMANDPPWEPSLSRRSDVAELADAMDRLISKVMTPIFPAFDDFLRVLSEKVQEFHKHRFTQAIEDHNAEW
jgi:hypothetical protein